MAETQQFCTFYLESFFFGVDVMRVQEIIRYQEMTQVSLAPDSVEGLINLRGQIVTAIDMRRRLGLPPRDSEREPMNVIIRTSDNDAISLLVDEIGDVLEMDAELSEPPPKTLQGVPRALITQAYKLEDRLLLILDADKTADVTATTAAAQGTPA